MALRKKSKEKPKEPYDGTHFYEVCYLAGDKFKTTFVTASRIAIVDDILMIYDNLNGEEILASAFSHWVCADLQRMSKKISKYQKGLECFSSNLSDALEEDY